jgi:ketosteroid isomerase-like protein
MGAFSFPARNGSVEIAVADGEEPMRNYLALLLLISAAAPRASAQSGSPTGAARTIAGVRAELEKAYKENTAAFMRWDVAAVMALRAPDFHTVTPDGATQDRQAMEQYITGIMNGIKKWNRIDFTIDSLDVRGDTAFATISQHVDRMALRPDNLVHHVETWVTQRETWVRRDARWLMWRVDQLRNQRRLVDGKPQ